MAITNDYGNADPPRIEPPMPPGVKVRLLDWYGRTVAVFEDRQAFEMWRLHNYGRRQRSDSERWNDSE